MRALVDYTRNMRKYEAALSERAQEKVQAEEAKAKEAAQSDQLRRELARRIEGFVEARQAKREAVQDQRPSIAKS